MIEFMEQNLPEVQEVQEEQTGFVVDSDSKAEWCLEKIREAQAEKEKWRRFYADRLEQIEKDADATIERMQEFLRVYFDSVPHKQTRTQQSYQLPSGKLVFKHQAPEYTVKDDELLPWLKDNGMIGYIKTKESPNWAELKKTLRPAGEQMATADGEIVPGITVTERPDIFKVEV